MCFEISEKEFILWKNTNKYHNFTVLHIGRSNAIQK